METFRHLIASHQEMQCKTGGAFLTQDLTVREQRLHVLQGCEVPLVLHQVLHVALCKGAYPGLRVLYCAA